MSPKELTPAEHSLIGEKMKTDFADMKKLADELLALCESKNKAYGEAWSEDGGQGAYFQGIARKWARIRTQAKSRGFNLFDVSPLEDPTESLDETLGDLVNYCLLTMVRRRAILAHIQGMESKS